MKGTDIPMLQSVNLTYNSSSYQTNLDLPEECPMCHTSLVPSIKQAINIQLYTGKHTIVLICFCPKCERLFFIQYPSQIAYRNPEPLNKYCYEIVPVEPEPISQYKQLESLSPKFLEIYAQAQQAESSGLNELCGTGYRKALEFLVKDYAIHLHPEDADKITKEPLLKCITNYIDDNDIKSLSVLSTWIGNDETHYERQNQELDFQSMKKYINSMAFFICMKFNAEEARNYIESKN